MSDEEKAYIAGFLDGDGCIMAQLVRRKDYVLGYQIRVSIVFYQKSIHREFLVWLHQKLKHGYIRNRSDGMSEYTIVGLKEVREILMLLYKNLRLKKVLAKKVLELIQEYPQKMTAKNLLRMSLLVDETAQFNYSKKRTITSAVLKTFLKDKIYSP